MNAYCIFLPLKCPEFRTWVWLPTGLFKAYLAENSQASVSSLAENLFPEGTLITLGKKIIWGTFVCSLKDMFCDTEKAFENPNISVFLKISVFSAAGRNLFSIQFYNANDVLLVTIPS